MAIHKRAMIANQKFIYKKEGDHLSGKLKYFQFRNDRDIHVKQFDEQGNPIRRWVDHGLGSGHGEIAKNCMKLATTGLKHDVGARTLVLSPQVEFMQAIPAERRDAVMEDLTEVTVDKWFEAMNLPTAEYAYVVHKGEVKHDRPEAVAQENSEFVHSHVVLAATVPGLIDDRDDYKVYKEQLEQLIDISREEMERIWTRELGAERVLELNQELEELTQQLQALDEAREEVAVEQATLSESELDEAMLEMYQVIDLDPPQDLLARVYDARDAELAVDPLAGLRALGFDIPEDDIDYLEEMRALGFTIADDPIEQDMTQDILQMARDLGFDIPENDLREVDEPEADFDLLDAYRELGFVFAGDEIVKDDPMDNILQELAALGFDIPPEDIDVPMEDVEQDDDMDLSM